MTVRNFRLMVAVVVVALVAVAAVAWAIVGNDGVLAIVAWAQEWWAAIAGVAAVLGAVIPVLYNVYKYGEKSVRALELAQEAAATAERTRQEAEVAREAEKEERRRWIARYSGHEVIVKKGNVVLARRKVGIKKAEAILDDESELSVFLKGIASPFGWINLDLVSAEAAECGLLTFDPESKTWVIDLAKNPPKPGAAAEKARSEEAARIAAETAARAARTLELLEQLAATVPALGTALEGLWREWQGIPTPSTNGKHDAAVAPADQAGSPPPA